MTQDRMQLSELLEMAGADEFVREMIGFVAQRLMELDVDNRCGASHGERSEARTNSRNGFRDRLRETRAGTIGLRIPRLRTGSYFPPFLELRRTAGRLLPPSSRKPTCRASRPARWMIWCRQWA